MLPNLIVRMTLIIVLMLTLSNASHGDDDKSITVDCSCKTKNNASWCATNLGDFQEITFVVTGYRKPDGDLTPQEIALLCKRHADSACLCEDVRNFSGTVR